MGISWLGNRLSNHTKFFFKFILAFDFSFHSSEVVTRDMTNTNTFTVTQLHSRLGWLAPRELEHPVERYYLPDLMLAFALIAFPLNAYSRATNRGNKNDFDANNSLTKPKVLASPSPGVMGPDFC